MKDKSDLVKGLIRKAESDLVNAEMCLSTKQSLDTVCFHAQQGAEKYIKAYLTAREADYPYIHNLITWKSLLSYACNTILHSSLLKTLVKS